MKYVVLANCQAGPISIILDKLFDNLERVALPAVHTITESMVKNVIDTINTVDIIFHQPIGESFGELSVEALKERFPHKKFLSFPSIYFDGYFPHCMYLRKPGGGTLTGTIGDYHDSRVVEAFLNGKSESEVVNKINRSISDKKTSMEYITRSINTLAKREEELDVKISTYLEKNILTDRLFYVFNHPANVVLLQVVKQLGNCLGLLASESGIKAIRHTKDYLSGYQFMIDSQVRELMVNKLDGDLYHISQGEKRIVFDVLGFVESEFNIYRNTPEIASIYEYALKRKKAMGY